MLRIDKSINNSRGQMAVIAVIVAAIVMLVVSLGISSMVLNNYRVSTSSLDSVSAYFLAESGVEDALSRLKGDLNYSGGLYNSPIGTYSIVVMRNGSNFSVRSEGSVKDIVRVVEAVVSIDTQSPEVAKYGVFGGDDVWMFWQDAEVRGNIWANDDFDITSNCKIYGNLYSAGLGGFFTGWLNWGAEIFDNPDTPGVEEGNVWSANNVKVWGGHVYGDVHSDHDIYTSFGGQIDGVQYPYDDMGLIQIDIPAFDFDTYEEEAKTEGTYFATATQFEAYVNSLDNGVSRTLPDGVYFIDTGNILFGVGKPIKLNGSIVVNGNISFFCGLEINAQNNLPAIAAGKNIQIRDYGPPKHGGDFVTINGVLYSERDVVLNHSDSGKDILVTGAIWGGDDMKVENASRVVYDPNVKNTVGFGFITSSGDVEMTDWTETL